MKLKEMDFAMETCLQFYIMSAIREKFLIHILGEIIFMTFSQVIQAIHGSSVGKYPYKFMKEFTLSFITFDQKLFSQWKCRRWLVKNICIKSYCFDQITKSNIIIPVIGDISITWIKQDQCQQPDAPFNFDGLAGLRN